MAANIAIQVITQDEINKAVRSRNLQLIDDVLMKVKLQVIALQDEIEEIKEAGLIVTRSKKYELNIAQMNQDRLEKRVIELGKKAHERNEKREQERIKFELYKTIARQKMPIATGMQIMRETGLAKNVIATGDPKVDNTLETIGSKFLAGQSFEAIAKASKITDVDTSRQLLNDLKDPDTIPAIETLFEPNENGEVEL